MLEGEEEEGMPEGEEEGKDNIDLNNNNISQLHAYNQSFMLNNIIIKS